MKESWPRKRRRLRRVELTELELKNGLDGVDMWNKEGNLQTDLSFDIE